NIVGFLGCRLSDVSELPLLVGLVHPAETNLDGAVALPATGRLLILLDDAFNDFISVHTAMYERFVCLFDQAVLHTRRQTVRVLDILDRTCRHTCSSIGPGI